MEAWAYVKTMDLSKEKKLIMAICDRVFKDQGLINKALSFCTNISSNYIQ